MPEIRPAHRAELDLLIEWAAREGWNPGLHDGDPFHAADPAGFLLAHQAGEPVAGISVVAYGGDFGFLGFYICRPEFRGQGLGWAVWQAGMARLGGRTVGLDGVVAQQANYARSGFVLAHRNIRFRGLVAAAASQPGIVALAPEHVPAVAALDARAFGTERPAFLRRWLDGTGGRRALVALDDGRVAGYGVVRPARDGVKIGPLFAATADAAERLFVGLAAEARGATVILDCPEPNLAATALAVRHGLTPVFETARMYRGRPPALPLDLIYGITSFELG